MDDDLDKLRAMLPPNEHILWSARPDPAVIFSPADAYREPLYLLFTAFALFWTASVGRAAAPSFFSLFGLVFIVIGAYLLIFRFFVKVAGKRRTLYAVTDRRALILKGGTLRESPLVGLSRTTTFSRDSAHVTVTFGDPIPLGIFSRRQYIANAGLDFMNANTQAPFAFYDVAEPDELLRALASAETRAPS